MEKRLRFRAWVFGMIAFGFFFLPAGQANAQEKKQAGNSAVIPVSRTGPRDRNWMKRHEEFVHMAKKGNIEVLFLGDSITDAWGGDGHSERSNGREIFEKEFLPLKAANFGIGGDRTQHVLWRLQHGELDGIHPKVIMLMIGTNNTGSNSADEIATGITAIVQEIHHHSPASKVLLLGIFPRGQKPTPLRDKIKRVNEIISRLDDGGKTVKYLDFGDRFLQPDGTISREIMPDFLHLTPKGYQIWADAVKEPINELLAKK